MATSFRLVPWGPLCVNLQVFLKILGVSLRTLVLGSIKITLTFWGEPKLCRVRGPGAQRSSPQNERRLHLPQQRSLSPAPQDELGPWGEGNSAVPPTKSAFHYASGC